MMQKMPQFGLLFIVILVYMWTSEAEGSHVYGKEQSLDTLNKARKPKCRSLDGRCIRRGKPCPEDLNGETAPGRPFCRRKRRCCYPVEDCNNTSTTNDSTLRIGRQADFNPDTHTLDGRPCVATRGQDGRCGYYDGYSYKWCYTSVKGDGFFCSGLCYPLGMFLNRHVCLDDMCNNANDGTQFLDFTKVRRAPYPLYIHGQLVYKNTVFYHKDIFGGQIEYNMRMVCYNRRQVPSCSINRYVQTWLITADQEGANIGIWQYTENRGNCIGHTSVQNAEGKDGHLFKVECQPH